ncbi:MAG: hypothetical protein ACLQVI_01920 [Polyangiaceae bacterium]
MKVRELIAMLEECEENAEVYIMSQPHWPFEHSVQGLVSRGEMSERDEDEEMDGEGEPAEGPPRDRWTAAEGELPRSDVFLVEGSQLRYGSKAAWDCARCR